MNSYLSNVWEINITRFNQSLQLLLCITNSRNLWKWTRGVTQFDDRFNLKSNARNPGVREEASATIIERSVDVRVGRRRLNWCNELIDWRCLRDRHRYTLETRLHVTRALAKRATSASRHCQSPAVSATLPPILLSGRKSDKCAELSTCQIYSALHAASLFSRSSSALSPLFRFVASRSLNSQPELIVGWIRCRVIFFYPWLYFVWPENRR